MNYFAAANAALYFAAAGWSCYHNRPIFGALWAAYALGAVFLVMLENGRV